MTLFTIRPSVCELVNAIQQRLLTSPDASTYCQHASAIMDDLETHVALWIALDRMGDVDLILATIAKDCRYFAGNAESDRLEKQLGKVGQRAQQMTREFAAF